MKVHSRIFKNFSKSSEKEDDLPYAHFIFGMIASPELWSHLNCLSFI